MRLLLVLALLLLLTSLLAHAQPPQRDTQLWSDFSIQKQLPDHFSVLAWTSLRFLDNVSRFGEQHVGGAFGYSPVHWFSTAAWYRFQRQVPTRAPLIHENRWFLEGTGRVPLPHHFEASDRNRFEWRLINGTLSHRYRNRYQLEWKLKPVGPFVAGESSYDWRFHEWNRHREYVGLRTEAVHHVSLETYFMHEDDSHSVPHKNVIGTALRFEY